MSNEKKRVFGFLGRPWEQTAYYYRPKAEYPVAVAERPVPAPHPTVAAVNPTQLESVPLPPLESDKFPKHWEIKLETEIWYTLPACGSAK
jgi:hypothetical protein